VGWVTGMASGQVIPAITIQKSLLWGTAKPGVAPVRQKPSVTLKAQVIT